MRGFFSSKKWALKGRGMLCMCYTVLKPSMTAQIAWLTKLEAWPQRPEAHLCCCHSREWEVVQALKRAHWTEGIHRVRMHLWQVRLELRDFKPKFRLQPEILPWHESILKIILYYLFWVHIGLAQKICQSSKVFTSLALNKQNSFIWTSKTKITSPKQSLLHSLTVGVTMIAGDYIEDALTCITELSSP